MPRNEIMNCEISSQNTCERFLISLNLGQKFYFKSHRQQEEEI